MANYSLFLNGVYSLVLEDIYKVQKYLPEQVLYLQPYAGSKITYLADDPPSADFPVQLLMSVTDDLSNIHFVCEIVGWDDKTVLGGRKREIIKEIILKFQPTEENGIYMQVKPGGAICRNLLHVRRMQKLSKPFSVSELIKISDNSPVSSKRTTAGGWSYIQVLDEGLLAGRIQNQSTRN